MNVYNSKAFVPEEVKKGLHLDLIKYLLDYNTKAEEYMYDIHITSDGYCLIVEWCDILINDEDKIFGKFQFVDYDETIYKSILLPDESAVYIPADEDEKAYLNDWLQNHPGYKQNEYGRWYRDGEYNTVLCADAADDVDDEEV